MTHYDRHTDRLTIVSQDPYAPELQAVDTLQFQHGPIQENGINGVQNEDVIKGLILRLQALNQPPHNCRENSLAITKLEEALHWLEHRTKLRREQGVEGTNEPHRS